MSVHWPNPYQRFWELEEQERCARAEAMARDYETLTQDKIPASYSGSLRDLLSQMGYLA